MLALTTTSPNQTVVVLVHDDATIATLVATEYETPMGQNRWRATMLDATNDIIIADDNAGVMPNVDYLTCWAGHQFNLSRDDVIAAEVTDPNGYAHHLVWRTVEITGFDQMLANVGMRSFLWDTPDKLPIEWKRTSNSGMYQPAATTINLNSEFIKDVTSRNVKPGDILRPGDFYTWHE